MSFRWKALVFATLVGFTSLSIALAQLPGPGMATGGPAAPAPLAPPAAALTPPPGASTAAYVAPAAPAAAPAPIHPVADINRKPIARVTNGNGTLPNDHGQVWREYDISPYTLRVTTTNRPEQAIVDWILRETGYEAWHSEPLAILSADKRTLRVYHTPEMQAVVSEMVDRFVNTQAETNAFGLRVVTMGNPSWRAKAQRIMHSVPVQSQGIQAWLLAKEDSSLLLADMRRRSDFRDYSSSQLLVTNGQSAAISTMRPKGYTGGIVLHPEQAHPGFEPQMAQFEEGLSLSISPLLSLDGQSIDAMIKCNVDQLEKLVPVTIDVPTVIAPRQHTDIEVPQWNSYRLHERFHWPVNQVLLISFGVVAAPVSTDGAIKLPFVTDAPRAELLVFVDSRGAGGSPPTVAPRAAQQANPTYRGRY